MVLIGEFKTLLKLIDLGSTMSQNQWIVKSGGKKGEVVKSGLRDRYAVRNDEGDQLLQDPNKLMLDAFKGVRRSPVAGTVNKVRKTLLFEEPAPTIQIVTTDQDVVAVGDTPAMQEIPVVQKQGEVEEETKLAEERSLY
ncbi:unnamed protein product [Brassica oleracea]